MTAGIFIMGTDTNVGKTFISMGISAALHKRGIDLGVAKLMMSGMEREDPGSDASLLKEMSCDTNSLEQINPFQFSERVTPYIAAERVNRVITLADIEAAWNRIRSTHTYYLVEGAGGLMAPMGKGYHVGHMAQITNLPLIIVARAGLGSANHTLLTIEKARALGLEVRGVILNGFVAEKDGLPEKTNARLIEEFSQVPVIGKVPRVDRYDRDTLIDLMERYVDIEALL